MSEALVRRSRRSLAVILAVAALAVVALSSPAWALPFSDVKGDEYFATAVDALSNEGVIAGHGDGTFGAGESVTRAELAVFLARVLDLLPELPPGYSLPFADLSSSDWCYAEVAALHQAGLVFGTSANEFSPNLEVNRQQAATFIMRALFFKLEQYPTDNVGFLASPAEAAPWLAGYRDRSLVSPEHVVSVADAYRLGVMKGTADGWLFPVLPVTRGQTAVMLHRAFYQPLTPAIGYPAEVAPETYADLSPGSGGPLVQMLEARLAALHYPCGPVDGVYDYRTRDAVMAFEKVERLSRDGRVGAAVWQKVFSAQVPAPRLALGGTRAEVDLARQVLFMIREGEVTEVVHVSTGKLGTPTGQGRVYHKDQG
ncbi:MAG TPA: S-layer homology domain-containing protein, partial [Thermoleophilia bacterium]|nr:S-layer homology domain-containing protein [Thermoleophilia bacterium]